MPAASSNGAHRRNYTPDPVATRTDAIYIGIPLLACIVAAGLAFFGWAGTLGKPEVAPIVPHTLAARPLPALGVIEQAPDSQRLIDIRTDAFRAGLLEGLGQTCGMQPLAMPIGAR
jgi:hypothetical protein